METNMTAKTPERRQKLLTIAIPTYNRARYLDLALEQLAKQLPRYRDLVEVIVSNNASPDNTSEVVQRYIDQGLPIQLFTNAENIGADRNVLQCFTSGKTKYILIMGDDDVLRDRALGKILYIISRNPKFGVIYLRGYVYTDNYQREQPASNFPYYRVYRDRGKFLRKIGVYTTFISGMVINKDNIGEDHDPGFFLQTELNHTNWVLQAILNTPTNIYVEERLLAIKSANTGGYNLCKVFGRNFNTIFSYFLNRGAAFRNFKILNQQLLLYFFPSWIATIRMEGARSRFQQGDIMGEMVPIFKKYWQFWIVVFPIIKAPVKTLKFLIKIPQALALIRERFF